MKQHKCLEVYDTVFSFSTNKWHVRKCRHSLHSTLDLGSLGLAWCVHRRFCRVKIMLAGQWQSVYFLFFFLQSCDIFTHFFLLNCKHLSWFLDSPYLFSLWQIFVNVGEYCNHGNHSFAFYVIGLVRSKQWVLLFLFCCVIWLLIPVFRVTEHANVEVIKT